MRGEACVPPGTGEHGHPGQQVQSDLHDLQPDLWADDQHSGDPRTLLEAEGITFDDADRARRSHRLTSADLAILLDKDISEDTAPAPETDEEQQQAAGRFETLLRDNQTKETVDGVLAALRFWK